MDGTQSNHIYENIGGNSDELERAIQVCLMGSDIHLPLTCMGQNARAEHVPAFEAAWKRWRSTLFAKVLAPHLVNVFIAAQRSDAKAIVAMDRALNEELTPEVAERSALAGCQFHASMDGARHVKELDKLHQAILRQEIAGHHATFFAAEAAVFHVPMMHLLPAFLYAEWRSARLLAGIPIAGSTIGLFQSDCQDALGDSRLLFASMAGDKSSISVCA